MKKQILTLIIVSIILLGSMVVVSAKMRAEGDVDAFTQFLNNLMHNFKSEQFSVVGDNKGCGSTGGKPNQYWTLQQNQTISTIDSRATYYIPNVCGGTNRLFDVFINGWTPLWEAPGGIDLICISAPCNVEVYCCPALTCSNPTTVTCSPAGTTKDGTSLYWCPGESKIKYTQPSYQYCQAPTTKTCYYKSGNSCYPRTYDANLFPETCEHYTYNSLPLYSTLEACLASKCVPLWEIGNWGACINGTQTRTVTDSNNCGTDEGKPATTQSCTIPSICGNGVCENGETTTSCPADCNTSPTQKCGDGVCNGTETCSSCPSDCGPCGGSCSDYNGVCRQIVGSVSLSCNSTTESIGQLDCSNSQTCCAPKGTNLTNPNCSDNIKNQGETGVDCGGPCPPCGTPPTCKAAKEIFYTDANLRIKGTTDILLVGWSGSDTQATPAQLEEYIPGFSTKYFTDKQEACCENLTYVYSDEKNVEFSTSSGFLPIFFKSKTIVGTYSVYECIPKDQAGFCLDFAQKFLSKYTHQSCQTNTIIFIVLVLLMLILIMRLAGG